MLFKFTKQIRDSSRSPVEWEKIFGRLLWAVRVNWQMRRLFHQNILILNSLLIMINRDWLQLNDLYFDDILSIGIMCGGEYPKFSSMHLHLREVHRLKMSGCVYLNLERYYFCLNPCFRFFFQCPKVVNLVNKVTIWDTMFCHPLANFG